MSFQLQKVNSATEGHKLFQGSRLHALYRLSAKRCTFREMIIAFQVLFFPLYLFLFLKEQDTFKRVLEASTRYQDFRPFTLTHILAPRLNSTFYHFFHLGCPPYILRKKVSLKKPPKQFLSKFDEVFFPTCKPT